MAGDLEPAEFREPPLPQVPDRPESPDDVPMTATEVLRRQSEYHGLRDMAEEVDRLSDLPLNPSRILGGVAPPADMTDQELEEGLRRLNEDPDPFPVRTAVAAPEHMTPGPVVYVPPKTFTTQTVPSMVFRKLKEHVETLRSRFGTREVGRHLPHAAMIVHPRDWNFVLEYLRQQGTLNETAGPTGTIEIDGLTVLPDVGAKVPHLELSVE